MIPLILQLHQMTLEFPLLIKKYFDVSFAPTSNALFGRTQTHNVLSVIPNTHESFRKAQTGSE